MRFMILVKATASCEAGAPFADCRASEVAEYLADLAKAGALVDVNRLQPSASGWRIEWSGGRKIVTDGPFAETKELIAGYTIIDVASREEAIAWAARFPTPPGGEGAIEVRQILDGHFAEIPGIECFRELEAANSEK
jgi:hypothetical protein